MYLVCSLFFIESSCQFLFCFLHIKNHLIAFAISQSCYWEKWCSIFFFCFLFCIQLYGDLSIKVRVIFRKKKYEDVVCLWISFWIFFYSFSVVPFTIFIYAYAHSLSSCRWSLSNFHFSFVALLITVSYAEYFQTQSRLSFNLFKKINECYFRYLYNYRNLYKVLLKSLAGWGKKSNQIWIIFHSFPHRQKIVSLLRLHHCFYGKCSYDLHLLVPVILQLAPALPRTLEQIFTICFIFS